MSMLFASAAIAVRPLSVTEVGWASGLTDSGTGEGCGSGIAESIKGGSA